MHFQRNFSIALGAFLLVTPGGLPEETGTFPGGLPQGLPEGIPRKLVDGIPDGFPERILGGVLEESSGGFSEGTPGKISKMILQEIQHSSRSSWGSPRKKKLMNF